MSRRREDLQAWFYRGQAAARSDDAHLAFERLLATTPDAAARVCRPGCALCCHVPVGVTPEEADRIADRVATRFDRRQRDGIRSRIVDRLRELGGRDRREVSRLRLGCVLLDPSTNRCTAYDVRPFPCRAWTSLDLSACEAADQGLAHPPPRPDGPAFVAGLGAQAAWADGTSERLELTAALADRLGITPRSAGVGDGDRGDDFADGRYRVGRVADRRDDRDPDGASAER